MESLHSLLRMHWDHEPTPNPSQEGNGQDADGCLLPSWEGSGVGRFMERSIRPMAIRVHFARRPDSLFHEHDLDGFCVDVKLSAGRRLRQAFDITCGDDLAE